MSSEKLLRSNTLQSRQQENIYKPDRHQQRDMVNNHGPYDVFVCCDVACMQIWSPEMLPYFYVECALFSP
jgi:hypothetical protein